MRPTDRDAILEEAAVCAEQQNRVGREWVKDSLWDAIIRRVPEAIRRLKSNAAIAQQSLMAGGAVPATSFDDYWWEARHQLRTQKEHARQAWEFALKSSAAPLPQVQSEALDARRLEFMMERGAWIAWSKDGESCRLFHRVDDGGETTSMPMVGWGARHWKQDPREAIDAAMADQQPVTPSGALVAHNDGGVA
jgi:hypothetical protein